MKEGIAGKIAKGFIDSKLTVLLMIVFMIIGVYSSFLIPREEEPQIDVPMADIFVGYPGANPTEVESRITKPLEKIISNVTGVKYVHSSSMAGQSMMIVQFYVGEDIERSYVKLYNEIMKHFNEMPQGVTPPLIKTRSIDDVPVLGLTFWSETYNDYELKKIAQQAKQEFKTITNVSYADIIGGRDEVLNVQLQPAQMQATGVDALSIVQQIKAANHQLQLGAISQANTAFKLKTNGFFRSAKEIKNLMVGQHNGMPIYLHQVANVTQGPENAHQYTSFGYGAGDAEMKSSFPSEYPSITLAVSKRKGADAMKIADQILEKVKTLKQTTIPDQVKVEVTRNYGETASQKVSELLLHLIGAIIAVTIVVMLAMGWRGGLVVFLSVPITFALTLLSYYLLDYTLNRITLFALVFVTGIVVDDSIIIAENMHRHFKMKRLPFKQAALYAINEVGNPTILATFTVIASVLPMAFVSGLMGPYMSPMPIGASIAMILSLFVALTITPYLGYLFLRVKSNKVEATAENESEATGIESTKIYKLYNAIERPLLENKRKSALAILVTAIVLFASIGLFFTKSVLVKMLPFDNKNEFQVIVDLPEGSTLEETAKAVKDISQYIGQQDQVVNYQSYIGAASPITFNGLVRHYDLRQGENMADIQVNIKNKDHRDLQSHDIAKLMRPGIQEVAKKHNANVKIVEVPPGPPVLSTIVAEVYGPTQEKRIEIAKQIKQILLETQDVVDVDWRVEAPQIEYTFNINKDKASKSGIATQQIVQTLGLVVGEQAISAIYDPNVTEQILVKLSVEDADRNLQDINQLHIKSQTDAMIPIESLVTLEEGEIEKSRYRKNQQALVYITAEMAGEFESPVYAILGMSKKLKDINLPAGYELSELYLGQPENTDDFTVKWDGEWQVTLEVFRDLGLAFGGVIIIIYMLIVGWFQNFKTPIVMMVAIPLSMIGIIIGHWIMGAFFTATSFIGMIALAGIMVRNSVLLIDFVDIRLNEGIPLKQAVIEAGAVRTTPILLTAGTVVIGAFVILFDPIFQGLAISLMGGTIGSTFLTLLIVPLVYYLIMKNKVK